ncbi:hypothetical protein ACS0TY_011349 [Phlomoides rotata]
MLPSRASIYKSPSICSLSNSHSPSPLSLSAQDTQEFLIMRVVFLLVLILIISGNSVNGLKAVEKKVCNYKSKKFWGVCLSDIKCTDVCKREGFQGGDCQGLRRRCYCYNHC